jgi:hypothetical protein
MSATLPFIPVDTTEATVFEVFALRQTCAQKVVEPALQKIQSVRKLCSQAETSEGNPQSWRKSGGGGGGGGRGGPNQQSSNGSSFSSGAKWRGGGSAAPQAGKQSSNTAATQHTYQPHARYVSKFTNSTVPVENTILNKVILNKLNTFSEQNYADVKAFLQQILDSDEKEFLQAFVRLVFEKATNEPTFCMLYAKMISELIEQYKSLSEELTRMYNEYLPIFEEPRTEISTNYDQVVKRNVEHVHRLGYSQFLSDLTRFSVLSFEQLEGLYIKIFEQIKLLAAQSVSDKERLAEYAQCLWRMTESFEKSKQIKVIQIRRKLAVACDPILQDIFTNQQTKYPGLDSRSKAYLRNCMFILRENTPGQTR